MVVEGVVKSWYGSSRSDRNWYDSLLYSSVGCRVVGDVAVVGVGEYTESVRSISLFSAEL